MTIPTLLFATRNLRKKQLFGPVFDTRGIDFVTLLDVALGEVHVDEVGATAEENALLKARAFHSPEWPLVLGDDAGLEIDAEGRKHLATCVQCRTEVAEFGRLIESRREQLAADESDWAG